MGIFFVAHLHVSDSFNSKQKVAVAENSIERQIGLVNATFTHGLSDMSKLLGICIFLTPKSIDGMKLELTYMSLLLCIMETINVELASRRELLRWWTWLSPGFWQATKQQSECCGTCPITPIFCWHAKATTEICFSSHNGPSNPYPSLLSNQLGRNSMKREERRGLGVEY